MEKAKIKQLLLATQAIKTEIDKGNISNSNEQKLNHLCSKLSECYCNVTVLLKAVIDYFEKIGIEAKPVVNNVQSQMFVIDRIKDKRLTEFRVDEIMLSVEERNRNGFGNKIYTIGKVASGNDICEINDKNPDNLPFDIFKNLKGRVFNAENVLIDKKYNSVNQLFRIYPELLDVLVDAIVKFNETKRREEIAYQLAHKTNNNSGV